MKSIKHRLLSLLLTLVTILSLLPTAAFAASNTGSGLKITTNQAYWSTRLLANGTPYSYRPPLVDGKLVYCMDSGLGYHYATASYLNSFTWTSDTGADADAVLQSAVTNSGLSEMDAATVENVKWMMTYLNDCKESNVGQLFMAVQTYVWENQSYKGEPGGDGDAGGYANADTYDLYLSLIDWLLEQKAQEDAEFQKQIEEYTAQGKSASIVEDQSAKWAVYAISSNRKNQSFFNYYGPRKLVTQDEPGGGGEEPAPPAGTGKITLKKTAGGTTTGLAGARFSIYFNGQIVGSDITNAQGEIYVEDAATGLWSFVETAAPDGFCVDPTPKSVYVDVSEGDREYTVAAVNYEKPDMKITKRDAMSGKPIAGTVFSIKSVTGSYSTSVTTGTDGSATLSAIPTGVYVVREESVPEPYIVTNTEQTVALRPGKTSEVIFVDYEKPGLEILKKNIANGEPIEGVTYRIEQIDGSFSTSATTDNHGRIFLDSVPVGTFKVTEINVPNHVILCPIPQEVALKPGETSTVTFFNALKPSLEIRKLDSVTGDPVKGAKFQIWYGSNHTGTGELNDLGTYFSDASGKIILPEIKDGWYKVTELEPASGYAIKEPATQECFISGGESKVLTFENTPLSAIIIRKVDSGSGQPLEGAWFRIRYLGGTSGTGGTVVGEIKTSQNGTAILTGLAAGTYVCEEISAPDGYVITDATETVYLSGKDQDVITVTFGNDKMGSLLIVKKDAVTGAPISDVEFFITDSDGSVIGNANGKYVTDSAGTIRIDGLTPGMTVIAKEVRAKDGYILDDTPQSIKIKRNAVMTLEFRNQPKGGVLVKKVDAVTNAPISDVEFLVTDSDGNLIGNANGKFVTDSAGTFTITDIAPGTTLIIKETRAKEGYLLDDTPQTVKVKSNEVTTVEFRNQPKGNLIIVKQDSITKEPLEGVQFKIVYWQLDPTVHDVTLEYPGQIIKLSAYDKPASLGVTITKRGNAQVMAGQSMRYDLTVANTSNVPLESFFWHDKIPYDVARPTTLTTGTYSARLNYRILYKTNYNVSYGEPGGTCADCVLNQFGSDGNNKGKACKNMRMLYLLRSGEYMPIQIALPPTSLTPYTRFVNEAFLSRRRKVCTGVVRIGLKKAVSGSHEYCVATFTKIADFAGEDLAHIRAYADGFVAQIKDINAQRAQAGAAASNIIGDGDTSHLELPDNGAHFALGAVIDGEREELPA